MTDVRKIINNFSTKNILVIGDVMLDNYQWGSVNRISPEAPVPVLQYAKEENRLGGAANVALNIKSLGAQPILLTLIGDDPAGIHLENLLNTENISTNFLVKSPQRCTTIKTRIFAKGHQLLRIDKEDTIDAVDTEIASLMSRLEEILEAYTLDAVILQDYNKGVLSGKTISLFIDIISQKNIPICVDPKKNNFFAYQQVSLFKPNLKELSDGLNISIEADNIESLKKASQLIREKLDHNISLFTLSEKGIFIESHSVAIHLPTHALTINDVSGAGDTVISIAALALADKASMYDIAYLSNLAGGLVCKKLGVATLSLKELLSEL